MKNTLARRVIEAGFAIAAVTTLAACGEDEPTRDADNKITESGEAAADTLELGDCVNEPDGNEFDSVAAVPCDESHDLEIYHTYDLDEGDFPGDEVIGAEAETTCGQEFETFAGIAYQDSTLDYYNFQPTSQSWAMGDREVQCVILDSEGPVEGSLEGAAR